MSISQCLQFTVSLFDITVNPFREIGEILYRFALFCDETAK